jgi:hypothetical protein
MKNIGRHFRALGNVEFREMDGRRGDTRAVHIEGSSTEGIYLHVERFGW